MRDKLIEILRSVPIADKTYPEYIEAVAERLIEADVCKASEVTEKIFTEIEKYLVTGSTFYGQAIHSIGVVTFADLKKQMAEEKWWTLL